MPWARASSLHRHLHCSAASWLPRDERQTWKPGYLVQLSREKPFTPPPLEPAPDGEAAQWGTEMHLAKEGRGSDPWTQIVDPHRERLWPVQLGEHEVPYAYNCRTGTVSRGPLGPDGDPWKEGRLPEEVTGTCDWVATLPTGDPWVDDLKTGWPVPDPLSPQLLFYALCVYKTTGSRLIRTSVTHWRRGLDNPVRHWRQVTDRQLVEFEKGLRLAWRRTLKDPSPTPGPYCRYCPSAGICPAIVGEGTEDEL